ncbi:hypothetical protein CYMTET_14661 [Cymbomonas tetramitiformis]|uniref:Uncharacterized protein n=1 Tax=Cymbomonas tetramitiformis TaxID=36881 RepID=A0AAE0L9S7_9CHLO|nr:hypothetical protein CYMTET_14661 [Cymbomonas tetramitiformis]
MLFTAGRRNWLMLKRSLTWLARSHPLGAIYLVRAVERYSRSERILIQANTFLLLFLMALWFYYSKAVNCCKDLREFLACPDTMDVRAPCLGFDYCLAVHEGMVDGLMPRELRPQGFACTAFPEDTFVGRMQAVFIIVACLTPVTLILSQMFIMASDAAIPGHWRTFPAKRVTKYFGPGMVTVMQGIGTVWYALFFNVQKFNKAAALSFVALIGVLLKPQKVQAAIRAAVGLLYWGYNLVTRIWFALKRGVCGIRQAGRRRKGNELIDQVQLVSPIEEHLQKVAYFCLISLWFWAAWSLATYAMLIREMMGIEEERAVISTWAITLAMEMFGKEAVKLVIIRLFINSTMDKLRDSFLAISPAAIWYEKHVMTYVTAQSKFKGQKSRFDHNYDEDDDDDDDEFEIGDESEGQISMGM